MARMKRAELEINQSLAENLRLQTEYQALIKKLLVTCSLVKEDAPYLDRFELLCKLEPTTAWEKQAGKNVPVFIESFTIIVFVHYGSKDRPATTRCLTYKDDQLLSGVHGYWEGRQDDPRWGRLAISLSQSREMTTSDFLTHDKVEKIYTGVGDYREEYTVTLLRTHLMKDRFAFLKQIHDQLGL